MVNTLLGVKKQMTSTYDSRGRRVGATVVEMQANIVSQVKSGEGKDGYNAVQLGYGTKKSVKKPQLGTGKKVGVEQPIRWFREVRGQGIGDSGQSENLKPGQEINLGQVFSIGDSVRVTGTSKGKGFQGGVRRHGFHGGPKTHGQSDRHRAPGSIGAGTTPGRVYKGKKMAGHMGSEKASTRGLEIVGVDKESNLLTIKGSVPGFIGGLVTVTKLGRIRGYTPPPEEKPEEEEEEKLEVGGGKLDSEVGSEKKSADTSEVKSEPKSNENTSEVSEGEQNAES